MQARTEAYLQDAVAVDRRDASFLALAQKVVDPNPERHCRRGRGVELKDLCVKNRVNLLEKHPRGARKACTTSSNSPRIQKVFPCAEAGSSASTTAVT